VKNYRVKAMILVPALVAAALSLKPSAYCGVTYDFEQTNLVSDLPGVAKFQDPMLVNPWGLVHSPTSPFWISDNGSGLSTLYTGAGNKIPLSVTIPPPASMPGATAAPTGIVFNGVSSDFKLSNGKAANFIFDTEDGTISGWNGTTSASLEVDQSGTGSVFKGLALNGGLLYATDFRNGAIDVFNSAWAPVALSGTFTDPSLPAGFAPFNIQEIDGDLYVSYAKQDAAKHDDVAGPGNGFIDIFDNSGDFLSRLVSNGALDSPWGMVIAPSGFGSYGGDLLVGNFGDGMIDVYNPTTGAFINTLNGGGNKPVVIQGLWGLEFGNGAAGGAADTLYFTAGIPGSGAIEDHGLFGSLTATVPDGASTAALLGLALAALAPLAWRRRPAAARA
jgi:uncharacterized protein (TIGR03118 family)